MSEYKISIIVPVYNCINYLQNSIGSIVNQTIFNELEVILIDDGSTDGGTKILKKFADDYENIYFYRQENRGVSCARNFGVEMSTGKHIAFFDADDIAEPKLYEKLLKLITDNEADISIVDYSMVFSNGSKIKHRAKEVIIWNDQNDLFIEFFKYNRICSNPVDKIFLRDTVKGVTFPEGYTIGEDLYYVYETLKVSSKVVLDSTESLYNYMLRDGSAMKSNFSEKKLDAVKIMNKIIHEIPKKTELYYYAEAKYYNEVCKALSILTRTDTTGAFLECKKKLMKELRGYNLIKAFKYMSRKHFVAVILMRTSPSIYNWVYEQLKIG